MAKLSPKVIDRLNSLYELGGEKFGTMLQTCLDEVQPLPPSASCLTIPTYTSQAAGEAACGQIIGNSFLNTTNNAFTLYTGLGWIEIFDVSVLVSGNTANILINTNQISAINDTINALVADLAVPIKLR